MCSILSSYYKVNVNLISIIKTYLLPNQDELKIERSKHIRRYMNIPYPNEFLRYYYLLQFKRKFPQDNYNVINNNHIIFKIDNLIDVYIYDEIFTNNTYITHYTSTDMKNNQIRFHLSQNY